MDNVRRKQHTINRPTTNLSLNSESCGGEDNMVSVLVIYEVVVDVKRRGRPALISLRDWSAMYGRRAELTYQTLK